MRAWLAELRKWWCGVAGHKAPWAERRFALYFDCRRCSARVPGGKRPAK